MRDFAGNTLKAGDVVVFMRHDIEGYFNATGTIEVSVGPGIVHKAFKTDPYDLEISCSKGGRVPVKPEYVQERTILSLDSVSRLGIRLGRRMLDELYSKDDQTYLHK